MKTFVKQPRLPKAAYDQNIDVKESIMRAGIPRKWCKNHPKGDWKTGFSKCRDGYYTGEECVEGKND